MSKLTGSQIGEGIKAFIKRYDSMESEPNTICPKCLGIFDSRLVKIKRYDPYEGLEIFVFDCPVCKEEINDFECGYIEEGEINDISL